MPRARARRQGGRDGELERFARFCAALPLEDGRPLELEPFQREILRDFFGGARELLVLLPKKNGKSTLLGALALWHVLRVPDAECVIAAASREQAGIILRQAAGFVRRSEVLRGRLRVLQRGIYRDESGGRVRVLASDVDTADGVIPTLALVDELHRHKTPELFVLLRDGLGPRHGQLVTISTAGSDENTPLGLMRRRMLGMPGRRRGAHRRHATADGSVVMHEWSVEALPGGDIDNLKHVKAANPASWHTLESLRARKESPATTKWHWARFAANVWMPGEAESAISPEEWAACRTQDDPPEGCKWAVGVDLGWKWDCTAVVAVGQEPGAEELWVGECRILEPPRDGTSLSDEEVLDAIRAVCGAHSTRVVVIDPAANGHTVAQQLEREGFEVIEHPQSPMKMALASTRLYAAVADGRLRHRGHEVLTDHVLSAVRKPTGGELWRLAKSKQSPRQIDGAIALAMAAEVVAGGGHISPWEDPQHELLVLA